MTLCASVGFFLDNGTFITSQDLQQDLRVSN
jgi:hypothetical protein